ncbi:hypothetical protein RD792_004965 [Penstemon davidsonii]|uniref:TPR1-like CTLH-containing domain-containing protein n=1 Tax=Penstemon davidsonii TaxID=160366 RepID=A0ABR0DJT6_9LAMI|nr:hypothetical protein RD792_004965 [Penstemon davidsonii]
MKIFFEIRKQKYLEALDRENKILSKYVDAQSARAIMFTEVKKLLELNPLVQEKLTFPHNLKKARLRTLINQRAPSSVPNPLMGAIPRSAGFPHLSPAPGPWMTNTPQVPHPSVFVRPIGLNAQNTSAIDGKIKAWLYDNQGSRVDYDAPGHSATTIAYNDDGTSHILVFVSTMKGLLAVSTSENGVKNLANKDGVQLLKLIENRPFDASRVSSASKLKSTSYGAYNVNIGSPSNVDRVAREPPMVPTNRENRGFSYAKSRTIEEYSQCRSLRLTYSSSLTPIKVSRLTYTNSGLGILALASHGVHKLWKWPQNYANPTGKLKTKLYGQHRRVTGLAFSNTLNVLVSSGANSQSIYVSCEDGSVGVLAAFTLRFCVFTCQSKFKVYPLVIVVHPTKPNQFALGLTDGGICILEPLESEGNWGTLTPPENRDDPSTLRD